MSETLKMILESPQTVTIMQMVLSLVLVIVTTCYAIFTYKILHASYKSILVPLLYDLSDNGSWKLKIKNCGPGIAKNVELLGIVYKNLEFQDEKKVDKVWADVLCAPAEGPFLLMPNHDEWYNFREVLLEFKYPIIIKWKTLMNKTQKSYWIVKIQNLDKIRFDEFAPLNFMGRNMFRIERIKIWIYSPYYEAHRKWTLWKRKKKV